MRLIALLSWFDESPTWLSTTVAGLGRFCDGIVAADGAYALYPGARPRSHPQQAEAIIQAAEAADIDCLVFRPHGVWHGNEVSKRNKTLDFAGTLEPDWIIVIDADYHLLRCKPDLLRAELENTDKHCAEYALLWNEDFQGTPALERFANSNPAEHEWVTNTRDIYRWHPSLEIGPTHFAYTAEIDGRRQPLKGYPNDVDSLDVTNSLVFYHRNKDRPMMRRKAAEAYYEQRNRLRIEA